MVTLGEETLNHLLTGKTVTQIMTYPNSLHIVLGDAILCVMALEDGSLDVDILGSTPDEDTEERRDRWGE